MKNKNRRKYKDGDKVVIDGCEYKIEGYHYASMTYALQRNDGLVIFVKADTIK